MGRRGVNVCKREVAMWSKPIPTTDVEIFSRKIARMAHTIYQFVESIAVYGISCVKAFYKWVSADQLTIYYGNAASNVILISTLVQLRTA